MARNGRCQRSEGNPPVSNVGDAPRGSRCEVDDQVDAAVIVAVLVGPAVDHLSVELGRADLSGNEAQWHEHRVERADNVIKRRVMRRQRKRDKRHAPILASRQPSTTTEFTDPRLETFTDRQLGPRSSPANEPTSELTAYSLTS